MFAIGDAEVVIRVSALIDAVGWCRRPDRHDGGGTLSALSLANFLYGHHFFFFDEKLRKTKLGQKTYRLLSANCEGSSFVFPSRSSYNFVGTKNVVTKWFIYIM